MNIKITNNTDYNITLINGVVIKRYSYVVLANINEAMEDQIKNLESSGSITVSHLLQ